MKNNKKNHNKTTECGCGNWKHENAPACQDCEREVLANDPVFKGARNADEMLDSFM